MLQKRQQSIQAVSSVPLQIAENYMVLATLNKSTLSSFIQERARFLLFGLSLQLQTFTSNIFPAQQKFFSFVVFFSFLFFFTLDQSNAAEVVGRVNTLVKSKLKVVNFPDFAPICPDNKNRKFKH